MTKKQKNTRTRVDSAAIRLAEMERLYQDIRDTLVAMKDRLGKPDGASTKEVLTMVNELNAAHLKLVNAEDAFHAKIGTNPDIDAIDFDAIRVEIGGQLDRIRASLAASGISIGTDAG